MFNYELETVQLCEFLDITLVLKCLYQKLIPSLTSLYKIENILAQYLVMHSTSRITTGGLIE